MGIKGGLISLFETFSFKVNKKKNRGKFQPNQNFKIIHDSLTLHTRRHFVPPEFYLIINQLWIWLFDPLKRLGRSDPILSLIHKSHKGHRIPQQKEPLRTGTRF